MADKRKKRSRQPAEHGLEYPELPGDTPEFEQTPLTRGEYITALSHFYRAELHRSLVWRVRLDTTTNWAIISTLAILTSSLSNPDYAREALLLGMLANIVFVTIEARRFRFFDVWRARVRMLEENFYGGILRRDQVSPQDLWGSHVADDLLCPRFHLSRIQAFRARLMRNFRYIFIFLLGAWLTNRFSPAPDPSVVRHYALPEWASDSIVGIIYVSLILIAIFTPKVIAPEIAYWGDPDHPGEPISSLDV